MKLRNLFLGFVILLFSANTFGQKTVSNEEKAWYVPDYAKMQFAGNIGLVSVGVGYEVFENVLFSELLYGYVPESVSKAKNVSLITIKNTFPLFRKEIGKYTLSPIAGFTTSLDTGNNSFLKLPEKYPKGYYITNAIHFTVFVGALFHKDFSNTNIIKGADYYIELGTVESYLWYGITNKEIKATDIFSTAIGVNLYL